MFQYRHTRVILCNVGEVYIFDVNIGNNDFSDIHKQNL